MILSFAHSFQAELLKTKRTVAFWMVVAGAFFTPVIVTTARLIRYKTLPALYADPAFWTLHWKSSWESMALFLLPLGVILITSLITQLEYRNNTWKQLHALPLTFTAVFFSKLAIIIVMILSYLLLFNTGIYLSAIIPYIVVNGISYPELQVPVSFFLTQDLYYFTDCLPIVALQYLISLKYKNFLVPVGTGFLLWVGALASLSWKHGYLVPYTYGMYTYLRSGVINKAVIPDINIHLMAVAYFLLFTLVGYALYVTKKEKG